LAAERHQRQLRLHLPVRLLQQHLHRRLTASPGPGRVLYRPRPQHPHVDEGGTAMYHAIDAGVIRVAAFSLTAPLPPWPDLHGDTAADVRPWLDWIAQVWADESVASAIEVATPVLAESVRRMLGGQRRSPRTVRRAAVSLARYLLRMQHRATPFGLFA